MREQLIRYVELLFAGASDADEIKQEILHNTLDRYDDLIGQGKTPEAAYRLAISGIGDINEILGGDAPSPAVSGYAAPNPDAAHQENDDAQSRKMRATAVAMYILCPVPLFIFTEFGLSTLGLCFTLLLVAAATALIMMARKKSDEPQPSKDATYISPQRELRRSIEKLMGVISLVVYLIVSFVTGAWFSTWLIFPIMGCIKGLVNAIWI